MRMQTFSRARVLALGLTAALLLVGAGCQSGEKSLTVYSGRTQSLVHPVLEAFGKQYNVNVKVRYGSGAGIVATLLEEGQNSPADVVFLQDPGSLGALSQAGMLRQLPEETLQKVDRRFQSSKGDWVGASGRVRVVAYNTDVINPENLPDSILDFTAPEWKGRIGLAPTNASFQSFVTALRVMLGEDGARKWLEGIKANSPRSYGNNIAILQAVARGEIDIGFTNHYYLYRFLAEEGPGFKARNYYIGNGDPGALVLVAGAGVLKTSKNPDLAELFVDYLLSRKTQEYFSQTDKEYPLVADAVPAEGLPPLGSLDPPDIDLGDISDLEGTLRMLRDTGVLQ